MFEESFREYDPNRPPVFHPIEGMGAEAVVTEAELRLLVHLDLGDQPAGRGIQPEEVDTGCLADQAAPSVAADEILGLASRLVAHEQGHVGSEEPKPEQHDRCQCVQRVSLLEVGAQAQVGDVGDGQQ